MRKKLLTQEEIKRAKMLRTEGYTKRQLAVIFHVSETNIWENIFASKNRQRLQSYRNTQIVIDAIVKLRGMGYTSGEVSSLLNLPLIDVNYIWIKNER